MLLPYIFLHPCQTQQRVSTAVPAVEERTWRSVQMKCEKDEENPKASILILFDVLLGCCRRQPRSNFLESTWNLRNVFFSLLCFSSTAATALDNHTFETCPKFICSDLSRQWRMALHKILRCPLVADIKNAATGTRCFILCYFSDNKSYEVWKLQSIVNLDVFTNTCKVLRTIL